MVADQHAKQQLHKDLLNSDAELQLRFVMKTLNYHIGPRELVVVGVVHWSEENLYC